jgi:hypothetical protein
MIARPARSGNPISLPISKWLTRRLFRNTRQISNISVST